MNVQDVNPEEKDENLSVLIRTCNRGEEAKWTYFARSMEFDNLPNTVIGYDFDVNILKLFKNKNIKEKNLPAKEGHHIPAGIYLRKFYEIVIPYNFCHYYNG